MATQLRISEVTEEQKEIAPLALPLADPLGADITTKTLNAFSSEDARIHAGIWETETGRSRWEFDEGGEVIYILGGAMTVERDGEDPLDVKTGDLVVFERGWKGFWNVTSPLSKVYVLYS